MIDWPAKEPAEVVSRTIDWTSELVAGETVLTRAVTAEGVTRDSDSLAGNVVTVWLSGGTEGALGKVTVTVATSAGRTLEELALVPIGGGPIDLARAKARLRVDFDEQDELIAAMLRGAVGAVENFTGRILSPRTLVQRAKAFPSGARGDERIVLLHDPVVAVTEVTYVDADDAVTVLNAADYRSIEGEPWSLLAPLDGSWPTTSARADAVRVRYVAGYEAGDCPPELQTAVLETLAATYDGTFDGSESAGLPGHVRGMCQPFRRIMLG